MSFIYPYSLELSSREFDVLQVALDHMAEHMSDLHTVEPSDRDVLRRLDAAKRLKKWFRVDWQKVDTIGAGSISENLDSFGSKLSGLAQYRQWCDDNPDHTCAERQAAGDRIEAQILSR